MTRLQEIDRLLTSLDNEINDLVGGLREYQKRDLKISSVGDKISRQLDWCTEQADKLKTERTSIQIDNCIAKM
jgi:hypothetical protein